MSLDPLLPAPVPLVSAVAPRSRCVSAGDFVIVQAQLSVGLRISSDWWMGQVMFCEGGARDPRVNTMFQVSNVDDGGIHWVNGDEVTQILSSVDSR